MKRYFEFVEGTSSKFWEISMSGNDVTTRWGRIGTEGQHQILTFETELEARREYERQCDKRTQDRQYSRIHDEAAPRDPEELSRQRGVPLRLSVPGQPAAAPNGGEVADAR